VSITALNSFSNNTIEIQHSYGNSDPDSIVMIQGTGIQTIYNMSNYPSRAISAIRLEGKQESFYLCAGAAQGIITGFAYGEKTKKIEKKCFVMKMTDVSITSLASVILVLGRCKKS
jgi:hypothetical protein